MQAMVDRVREASLPNTSVSVTPSTYRPLLSTIGMDLGDGYVSDRTIGRCVGEHSAHVAERWGNQVQQAALTPSADAGQMAKLRRMPA